MTAPTDPCIFSHQVTKQINSGSVTRSRNRTQLLPEVTHHRGKSPTVRGSTKSKQGPQKTIHHISLGSPEWKPSLLVTSTTNINIQSLSSSSNWGLARMDLQLKLTVPVMALVICTPQPMFSGWQFPRISAKTEQPSLNSPPSQFSHCFVLLSKWGSVLVSVEEIQAG